MNPEWRRICGLHSQDDGLVAAVWMAHDKSTDAIHLYDCAKFANGEVLAVIGEGINARGRWIPVAWHEKSKELANKLLDRGCRMLPESVKDDSGMAEIVSRDVLERMRTGRFKVDKRLAEWLDEYKSFFREGGKVPLSSHPLMSATRHAVAQLESARRQQAKGRKQTNYAKVAMI